MIYIFPLDYRGKTSETHGAGSFGLGEETAHPVRIGGCR